jgi:hypothetical protein
LGIYLNFYPYIERFVHSTYTAWRGDLPSSIGAYERILAYCGFVTITILATPLSLRVFYALSQKTPKSKLGSLAILGWEMGVVGVLIWSYEVGFPSMLNDLAWAFLGPPDDLYSWTNLTAHRIVAWMVCTTPVAWVVLCLQQLDEPAH